MTFRAIKKKKSHILNHLRNKRAKISSQEIVMQSIKLQSLNAEPAEEVVEVPLRHKPWLTKVQHHFCLWECWKFKSWLSRLLNCQDQLQD